MARFPRKAARGWLLSVAVLSIIPSFSFAQDTPPVLPPVVLPAADGIEVQASGPIHEAFAQPTDFPPRPSEIVPKQPPAPIPEVPPEERPDNDKMQWIPGYWSWDAERQDFVWVSGVYRVPPVGRQFVPGYWAKTETGSRWVAGYWAPEQQPEPNYVPEPPATLEVGPSSPGPEDGMYVQGYWYWDGERFVWRPGYWSTFRQGRIWTPGHYVWTPQGYIFVDGYWDMDLEERGVLFAPVTFASPYWNTPGWYYRPSFVVGIGGLFNSLFCGPYGGFYFGNFYGPRYAGYSPWFNRPYNPYYAYYRNQYRNNPAWANNLRQVHQDRIAGRAPLPPRTFAQQAALANNRNGVVRPLGQAGAAGNFNFVKSDAAALAAQKDSIQRNRQIAQQRAVNGKTGLAAIPNLNRLVQGNGNFGGAQGTGQSLRLPDDAKARLREFRPSNSTANNNGPPLNLPFRNAGTGQGNAPFNKSPGQQGTNTPGNSFGKAPGTFNPPTIIEKQPFGAGSIGKVPGVSSPTINQNPGGAANQNNFGKSPGSFNPPTIVNQQPGGTNNNLGKPPGNFNPPAIVNQQPGGNNHNFEKPPSNFNPPTITNRSPTGQGGNPGTIAQPKLSNPTTTISPPSAPKFNPPAISQPKFNPPAISQPKFNPPSTPAPRISSPPPSAPRISSPPPSAPRMSSPPSRPSGGSGGGGAPRRK